MDTFENKNKEEKSMVTDIQSAFETKRATLRNVKRIKALIDVYAAEKIMLPRTIESIQEKIRDFFIVRDTQGKVVACVALQVINDKMAEIRSLAVEEKFQHRGIGSSLMKACLEEAKRLGLEKVFALTFVDVFFKKFGFSQIDRKELPYKIWNDCIICPYYLNCREIAMIRDVAEGGETSSTHCA